MGTAARPSAPASDPGVDAVRAEAGTPLRCGVGATVVRGHDLYVLGLPLSVRALVFDAHIGEMDVAVDDGKVAAGGPLGQPAGLTIEIPFLLAALAIQIPQESLIVTLQLVVEDHAL